MSGDFWTRSVRVNYDYIREKLCRLRQVVDHFTEAEILTTTEAQYVLPGAQDLTTDPAGNKKFLDLLLGKGERACEELQHVLKKTSNPHVLNLLVSTSPEEIEHLGAYGPSLPGPTQTINIRQADNVNIYNQTIPRENLGIKESETHPGLTASDVIVSLLEEILSKSPEGKRPIHDLEQHLCKRLRKVTGRQVPSFQEFVGIGFRNFLEQKPSSFSISTVNNVIWVEIRDDKKGKNKSEKCATRCNAEAIDHRHLLEHNTQENQADVIRGSSKSDSLEWTVEDHDNQKAKQMSSLVQTHDPAESGQSNIDSTQSSQRQSLAQKQQAPVIESSADEFLLKDLLAQPSGDTVIFKRSVREYDQDRLQFSLDVVSLWNTPHRDKAYIILGVDPNQKTLIGIHTTIPETFFKDLFQWQLFQQLPPQFSYREVTYERKCLGIIQVEVSFGHGFPCIARSDDMAPKIQRNQLWVRRKGINVPLEALDLFVGNIHAWFQGKSGLGVPFTERILEKRKETEDLSKADIQMTTKPLQKTERKTCSDVKTTNLMKALHHFKKGHFVLVCGSLSRKCRNIESLANAPWIAVYDFDMNGRNSGLLANLEGSLKEKRSVSVTTWCDPSTGLTELGTQWWSLRGRREILQSQTSDTSHQEWFSQVRDKLEKLCIELARFNEDYTVLTFLLLWPASEIEAKCMHRFLLKVQERLHPKLILCSTDPELDIGKSRVTEMIQYEFESNAEIFQINLEEFCSETELLPQDTRTPDNFQYRLPAEEDTQIVLTNKDAAWLAEDLDVLYLENPHARQNLTTDDLKKEAEHFFRGGTIRWSTWYDVGPGYLDVKRSVADELMKYIKQSIDKYKSINLTVFHAPGSGGSTMAQRLLWDLHEIAPCAKVRQRSGSSPEDIADKLVFLHQRSCMPVVALFDGEDEPRLKQILAFLHRSPVVVLQLKRYLYHLSESNAFLSIAEPNVRLSGFVSKKESCNLVLRYTDRCVTDTGKSERLKKLDKDVQEGTGKHQMFEYGMTVYAHEFQGVRAYVRGYLDLPVNPNKKLEPWQKCLGYIALVYFYGQTSIPCQFFVHIMQKPASHVMSLSDFPEQFQILVVQDSNEGRRGYLRIAHYIIAREILEQILNRRSSIKGHTKANESSQGERRSSELSKDAKQCLKNVCIDFIHHVAQKKTKSTVTSHTVAYILTKTFIFRDNAEISDIGTQDTYATRKRPQFSQIMNDVDSSPPYDGRLEILQSLCNTFPDDPNLRAHLGRFFSLCRPNEEETAESHFKAALTLCYSQVKQKDPEDLDERSKQTLMHVYHMFGNAYQRRIAKYTGWNPGDEPKLTTPRTDMEERLEEVIHNAKVACEHFLQARLHTPIGLEDWYTYMNDIHVRLQACDFVNRVYPGDLRAFLSKKAIDQYNVIFVRDCVTSIEDLIMECYNITFFDKGGILQKNLKWYNSLFNRCIPQLKAFVTGEDLFSLRLSICRKKLTFRGSDNIVAVENPEIPEKEIESIVSELESIFKYENSVHDISKRMLDLHYKDWILAIRNPVFPKVYSLEQVLTCVRQWNEAVRSPQSTFYLFVLLALLGLGTQEMPGSTDYLAEAEMLQEDAMPKMSKTVVRPRYPREWLGQDSSQGIRRLVTSSGVGHVEDRCIKNGQSRAKLAVCRGTIRARNKKLAGFIDLDPRENRTSVKVFFIPMFAKMEGSRYEGERVQFHLAFTLEKGFEAYEVKPLERTPCGNCHQKVEITWNQQEIVCSCGAVIINKGYRSSNTRAQRLP